jgi:hypothetical protein
MTVSLVFLSHLLRRLLRRLFSCRGDGSRLESTAMTARLGSLVSAKAAMAEAVAKLAQSDAAVRAILTQLDERLHDDDDDHLVEITKGGRLFILFQIE